MIAKWVEQDGADAIHVSTGSMFTHPRNPPGPLPIELVSKVYQSMLSSGERTFFNYLFFRYNWLRPIVKYLWESTIRDKLRSDRPWEQLEGINLDDAHEVKKAVNIPVICTGGFQTAQGIRDAIKAKKCDAVSMARPLLANPDLPNQMREASEKGNMNYKPKIPCTCCNKCCVAVLEYPLGCYERSRFEDHEAMMDHVLSFYSDGPDYPPSRFSVNFPLK